MCFLDRIFAGQGQISQFREVKLSQMSKEGSVDQNKRGLKRMKESQIWSIKVKRRKSKLKESQSWSMKVKSRKSKLKELKINQLDRESQRRNVAVDDSGHADLGCFGRLAAKA